MSSTFKLCAVTFHAAADQMRTMKAPEILGPTGNLIPENPSAIMARQICADVLQVIGNVYLGLAVNEQGVSDPGTVQ